MNRPKDEMWLGHPLIVTLVLLGLINVFWAGCYDSGWWVLGFVLLWPGSVVARASTARKAYLQWKQAWDAMEGQPALPKQPRSATPSRWRPWLGSLMLVGIWLFCLAHSEDPLCRLAVVWLIVAGIIAGIAALILRSKTMPRRQSKTDIVTVCIGRPPMPVPSLKDTYRAMPEHCLSILGIGRR